MCPYDELVQQEVRLSSSSIHEQSYLEMQHRNNKVIVVIFATNYISSQNHHLRRTELNLPNVATASILLSCETVISLTSAPPPRKV